ncbi:MAG: sigma 54-interacting transcriptional regulator [Syntrophobacteraceae bacterium]
MNDTTTQCTSNDYSATEELKILLEISGSLHKWLNVDDILPYAVSCGKELMDAETVSVLLYDPSRDEFFFRFSEGNIEGNISVLRKIRVPAVLGIAGSVFRSGIPELIREVAKDPRHYKAVDEKTRFQTKSMIVVPMEVGGRIIGVLEACNKRHGDFSQRDVDILMKLAGAVAMALDNAKTYENLKKEYEDLRQINMKKDDLIKSARAENAYLRQEIERRYSIDEIKGNSPQMRELLGLCKKVVNTDVTVLIEGETGTGKELLARYFHYNGPRRNKRFVLQDCGAIPETLLASELFGYRRGAFTGATSNKRGLFKEADGGTIFLDEVCNMSPAMQVSLLRVLQEGEFKPLGAAKAERVDVRVIAATNRSLEEDVKNGIFREDLFYRLSVFTVKLPPLREREGDIPFLADYFVRKFNQKLHKSVKGISVKAIEYLSAYPFPGNLRELENEIARAVAIAENGKCLETDHLSERVTRKAVVNRGKIDLKGRVRDMEKEMLANVLEKYGGNKTRTAKALGMSRYGLIKKLRRFGF